jgi:hypothetical protein
MVLEGGEGSASRPGRPLPSGKTRYTLYRRLGEPQDRFVQGRKISPLPGFDPRTVQLYRYTDYATRLTHRQGLCVKSYGLQDTFLKLTGRLPQTVHNLYMG